MITIALNGAEQQVEAGTSVADLITTITGSTRGSAVVVDDEVVPRSQWPTFPLADGQSVELITAVQGG